VFTPVNIDDWLLVDGGALNNVPADVVREMGADIVISVNVAADPATAEEDREAQQSLFALLGRTIDTMMTGSVRQALEKSDVVVDPDLRGLNSMDWRKSDELSLRGLQGAEAQAARLTAYQLSTEDHAAFMAARAARRRTTVPIPQSIVIRGASPRDEEYIRGVLATHVGKPFDEEALVRDVLGITGRDLYEYLTYRFSEQEGKPALVVNVRPKSYGPPFLNLLFELSNVDSSSFAANLGGRVTAYDVLGAGSELRGDFILGTEQGIAAELYNPIGRAGLFVAPRAYFERTGRNYYIDEVFVAEYRVKRAGVGADVGWTSGRRAEIRFGADIADLRGRRRVGDPRLPEASGTEKSVRLQFVFDGQTSPMVPTRGLYLRSGLRRYLAVPQAIVNGEPIESQKRFWQGETEASAFHRLPNDDRLFALAGGGTSFGAEPLFNDFALGGPLRLGAFNNDELRGDNFLLLTAGYLHKIGRLPDVLGGNFYLGGWLENGTAFDDWDDQNWRSNVSVGAVLESLLGPVYFGASVGFDGRHRFYVALGPFLRY
jgi:NTE family protein